MPVTFPESYPFSLVSLLPNAPRNAPHTTLASGGSLIFNPGLGETAIVFLVLVLSSPRKHVLNFLESSLEIEGRDNFAALLSQFFKVSASILDNDAFPSSWLNVNILAHKVLIKMMDPVASLLERDFIPDQDATYPFDTRLWREGFYMLLKLLSSEQLVIEEFSPQVCPSTFFRPLCYSSALRNVERCGVLLAIFVEKGLLFCCACGQLLDGLSKPLIQRVYHMG